MSGPNMNSSRTSHAGVSLGNSKNRARMGGTPVAAAAAIWSMTYGRNRSRIASCSRIMPYASSPKDQTSLGPPVSSEPTRGAGSLTPWSLKSGQKTPNWNQRTTSSRKYGELGSPPLKPPMSVVHHGIPEMAMFKPAGIWAASASNVESVSPDHTAAPYR